MARRSIPSFLTLWQRHETLYIGLFSMALHRLSENTCHTSNEDMISERLCPILNTLCYEESQSHKHEIRTPDWEKPIQPVTEDELKGGKIRKRPDFTCKLTNTFAACADEHEIPFHVECKRLGAPSSANWKLNENYVTEGIMRFDCISHEYGKRAISGMMIGYIISMSPENIKQEVNSYQKHHCPNNPEIVFGFNKRNIQQSRQDLNRKNVKPDKFMLTHLWVDLRN
ncbi:MAG: hypothetical protein WA133_07260 [Syntrophales bacterium]